MRTAGAAPSCAPPAASHGVEYPLRFVLTARLADYGELIRPKIALLSLLSVAVGYVLAATGSWSLSPLLHALFGIALVAAGSSALNQLLERTTDARMERTATRPLPAGRLSPLEVFLFGSVAGGGGCLYLLWCVNALTALLAGITLLLYVLVYTPLKRRTSFCTLVGAIPGALPPVLGWTAAGGALDVGAFTLFAILFLWQFPHFLAIGWLYQRQYSAAGLRMLPGHRSIGRVPALLAVAYAVVLLPASLLPSRLAIGQPLAGDLYTITALILGVGYFVFSLRFLLHDSTRSARSLLWASLVYLPVLLIALTWDHFQLLR